MTLTLTEFPVDGGKIKITLSQLPRGNGSIWRGIDIRRFFPGENGQDQPTRKGIMIPIDIWPVFLQAIDEVSKRFPASKAA